MKGETEGEEYAVFLEEKMLDMDCHLDCLIVSLLLDIPITRLSLVLLYCHLPLTSAEAGDNSHNKR